MENNQLCHNLHLYTFLSTGISSCSPTTIQPHPEKNAISRICHNIYDWRCEFGDLVTRKTAVINHQDAENAALDEGKILFFPFPKAITDYSQFEPLLLADYSATEYGGVPRIF